MTETASRGKIIAPGTIRFERELPGDINTAWAFFTESGKQGATTRLTLTYRRLGDEVQELVNVGAGWHTHLGILIERMADRTPEPFFTRFEEVEAEYAQAFLADKSVRTTD